MIRIKVLSVPIDEVCFGLVPDREIDMTYHGVVWLDYRRAKIIGFNLHSPDIIAWEIYSHGDPHSHHKAGVVGAGHANPDPTFFRAIADELQDFHEVLIVGPAETKLALVTYLRRERPRQALHISGSASLDRRTDGEIVEFARDFFRRADRMTPQI